MSDVDKWDNETAADGNSDKDDNGLDNAEDEDTSKGVVDKSSSEEDDTEDDLSTGAIIGIVIAVVALPLAIVYFGQRRRQQLQNQEELARN